MTRINMAFLTIFSIGYITAVFTDIPALNLPMVHHEQNQYVLKTNFLYLFHYRSVDNNSLQDGPEYNCWKCDYKVVLKTEQKNTLNHSIMK